MQKKEEEKRTIPYATLAMSASNPNAVKDREDKKENEKQKLLLVIKKIEKIEKIISLFM